MIQSLVRKLEGAPFRAVLGFALALVLTLALAGCGRRGPLETPPTGVTRGPNGVPENTNPLHLPNSAPHTNNFPLDPLVK